MLSLAPRALLTPASQAKRLLCKDGLTVGEVFQALRYLLMRTQPLALRSNPGAAISQRLRLSSNCISTSREENPGKIDICILDFSALHRKVAKSLSETRLFGKARLLTKSLADEHVHQL